MKLVAILIVVFFIGCKTCEKNIRHELTNKWNYDSSKKEYVSDMKFLTQLDSTYKECLYTKDTTYISKLFGTHYSLGKKGDKFMMQFTLVNFSQTEYGVLDFLLSDKYKVEAIYFVGITGGGSVY